ncbi:winged helix DNA-binding domain-containing protein [Streptomyces sp. NPDC005963]|uniref:winged helix DNA-binding domain-containing protein n=1 Tax=Streptomyces sp. NPDC005963 TaxID=3156721 RepID=UPI0033C884FE
MTTRTVTWTQSNARTLARQGLDEPLTVTPAAITSAMLAAQAQVLSAAELSVALRLGGGVTRTAVSDALWTEGSLVKTYGPRGTIHLLARDDLPMWTGALTSIPDSALRMPEAVGLTAARTEQIIAAIADALTDVHLTTDELTEAIVTRTGPWAGDLVMEAFQGKWPRWRQVTHLAAHRGVLAFAPNKGRRVAYTNPLTTPMEQREALGRLVVRYLGAYGPATSGHFARWLAAPQGWARQTFASLAGEGRIEPVRYEGDTAWVAAGDGEFPEGGPRGVRLLPYFDAYAIASQPRDLLFPGPARERALAGGQAGNYPVVLVDGTVAGVWHLKRSRKRIAVTVEPIGAALDRTATRAELSAQVERVAQVLESRATLTVGTVLVGPHA